MSRQLPWEIQDARDVLAQASRDQSDQQEKIRDAVKAAARANHLHRVALARVIGKLRDAGKPVAVLSKLAQGDEAISLLRMEADEAEGDKEIAVQEGWRLNANRKDSQELADWSKRRELAEGYGQTTEPRHFEDVSPRRAA
jgi:hypothetical protein